MASSSRIGLDSVVRYCTGEGLSDSELENELDEMEVESDDEELESGMNEEAEEGRVQNLLQRAYSQQTASCSMPAERDSLLLLDPDLGK